MGTVQERDPERRLRFIVATCLLLLVAQAAIGVAVPAGLGWDFANFYDAGHRVAAGQVADLFDPESPIAGGAPQGSLAFWSTPISAAFYAPLSALSPEVALVVFKLQNSAALFAVLALLFALYRRLAGDSRLASLRFAALFAFVSLIYQPLWTIYRVGGQTTPTSALFRATCNHCVSWRPAWGYR